MKSSAASSDAFKGFPKKNLSIEFGTFSPTLTSPTAAEEEEEEEDAIPRDCAFSDDNIALDETTGQMVAAHPSNPQIIALLSSASVDPAIVAAAELGKLGTSRRVSTVLTGIKERRAEMTGRVAEETQSASTAETSSFSMQNPIHLQALRSQQQADVADARQRPP